MSKFLDEFGLARVWTNIKNYIDSKSGTGVASFNGRTGAVTPQTGDYTAAMVGAATMSQVSTAISESRVVLTQAQFDAIPVSSRNPNVEYCIKDE